MGSDESTVHQYERNNDQMIIEDYDVDEDPDFDIRKYCKENETLDPVDIINIRRAFLDMREDGDPVETVRVRKLRHFPFLSPEDITLVSQIQGSSRDQRISEANEERENDIVELVSNEGMNMGSAGPSGEI